RAQKMEAIGQLVAGVSHNFNNLLTVTMGHADVLLERHPEGDRDRADLVEIRRAAERGGALTRQLLAFGPSRMARTDRVDVNELVLGLKGTLTPVLRDGIRLTIEPAPGPAAIVIDPNDFEQVIVNLVFNARDALPSGGTIHVDVASVRLNGADGPGDVPLPAGEYVRVRVSDNGTGMAPEVQAHLFEPFFTTKEVGQGTGLGLAFVHGIARQAGGFVSVHSVPSEGTVVSLYFPPATGSHSA
ncbi:MAG TPA: ATP-binding protein, partial [Vicinamibacterales bacterium]